MEKEEKKKGKDKSKDKAEKSQYVEVKNEPLSEDEEAAAAAFTEANIEEDRARE